MNEEPRESNTRIDAPTRYTVPILTALTILITAWALIEFKIMKPGDEGQWKSTVKILYLLWSLVAANWLIEFFRIHKIKKMHQEGTRRETGQKERYTKKKPNDK